MKCEQHLQTLKDNMALQDSLGGQASGQGERHGAARGPEVTFLEQEWTRRLIETKETYDRAIQEYKDQLSLLQDRMETGEQEHHSQVQKLTELLAREQERRVEAEQLLENREKQGHDENREQRGYTIDSENGGCGEDKVRQGHEKNGRNKGPDEDKRQRQEQRGEREIGGQSEDRRTGTGNADSDKGTPEAERRDKHDLPKPESASRSEESDSHRQPLSRRGRNGNGRTVRSTNLEDDGGGARVDASTGVAVEEAERYREALDLIVQRLENLQMSRDWVETTVSVVKETISRCLQEWRESVEQQQVQRNSQAEQLHADNIELRKKLREKSKKVESLTRQCSELEQENTKLVHQCSLAESRVSSNNLL